MTGRTSAVLAAAALGITVIAVAVRPLLPHHPAGTSSSIHATPALHPADTVPIAVSAATHALACPPPRPAARATGCGRLDITRAQVACGTVGRCQVELIGTLHTTGPAVPIALTVTMTGADQHWRAIEVAS
jgi:hypothetical protein